MQVTDKQIHYLKSILEQLRQLKSGVAFSRLRSMLGQEVLADNVDWLDCHIDVLEKELANATLSRRSADEHSGGDVQRGAGFDVT
jgi:hypothetical protein